MITREMTDKITACILEHKCKFVVIKIIVNGCITDIRRYPTSGCSHRFMQYLNSKGVTPSDEVSVEVLFATQSTWYAEEVALLFKDMIGVVVKKNPMFFLVEVYSKIEPLLITAVRVDDWKSATKSKKGLYHAFKPVVRDQLKEIGGLNYKVVAEGIYPDLAKLRHKILQSKRFSMLQSLFPYSDISRFSRKLLSYEYAPKRVVVKTECACGNIIENTSTTIGSIQGCLSNACRKCKGRGEDLYFHLDKQRRKYYSTIPKVTYNINTSNHTEVNQHMRMIGR